MMAPSSEGSPMPTTISHWVDGAPYAGTSDRFADVTNPATGATLSFADLAISSAEPYRDAMPIDFDAYPNVQRFYDTVALLPAWQKALGTPRMAVAAATTGDTR